MSRTILVPHAIADRCYLSEALLWVAVCRFPLAFVTENGVDGREDADYIDGLDPYLPFNDPISNLECTLAGLRPNPEYEDFVLGDFHQTPENLRTLLKVDTLADEVRNRWEQELTDSLEFYRRQAEWDAEYEALVDEPKARLFLALREQRLNAFGRKLPRETLTATLEHLESTDWEDWNDNSWIPIPADFWISNRIDWEGSSAEGRVGAYALILIETDGLLKSFPLPPATQYQGVVKIANNLVLASEDDGAAILRSARGRPPLNWESFHVELARRIANGGLPRKQEALIVEMQEWCKTNWHRDVGRSTLLQKLKPYYDALVRPSEKAE
jgi:hypothetical protein